MLASNQDQALPLDSPPTVDGQNKAREHTAEQVQGDVRDGGLLAWSQVLAMFFVACNTWGYIQSYGVFQSFYQLDLLASHTPSEISWIGSVQSFLLVSGGMISGPICDHGHARLLLVVGGFFITLGTMMTSLSTTYYQVMLAQGICSGIGQGCLWIPSLAMVAGYFDKKRPLAMGILSLGGAIGGIIFPVIFHRLQPSVGFPWAVRIIGFVTLVLFAFSVALARPRPPPGGPRRMWDPAALRQIPFLLCSASSLFVWAGIFIPWFYLQVFALRKTNSDSTLAFYLLPIASAGSFVGRLVLPALSLQTGPLNMLIFCCGVCSLLCFCWIAVNSVGAIVAFSFLYGVFSGGVVSLAGAVIASISPPPLVGTRLGMCLGLSSFGLLFGNPAAGALVNVETGDFVRMQVLVGCFLLASTLLLVICAGLLMRNSKSFIV